VIFIKFLLLLITFNHLGANAYKFTTMKDCRSKHKPHEPFYPPKRENCIQEDVGKPRLSPKCLEREDENSKSRERIDEGMRELKILKIIKDNVSTRTLKISKLNFL